MLLHIVLVSFLEFPENCSFSVHFGQCPAFLLWGWYSVSFIQSPCNSLILHQLVGTTILQNFSSVEFWVEVDLKRNSVRFVRWKWKSIHGYSLQVSFDLGSLSACALIYSPFLFHGQEAVAQSIAYSFFSISFFSISDSTNRWPFSSGMSITSF